MVGFFRKRCHPFVAVAVLDFCQILPLASLSPIRFEQDQNGFVFTEVELLLEVSVAADLLSADIHGRAAVFGFDFINLGAGQLRGRAQIAICVVGVVDPVADLVSFHSVFAPRQVRQGEGDLVFRL